MPGLVVGSPPRGGDYFGQDSFVDTLWERLDKGNVLLAAPRRFGKTGAMFQLLDEPREGFRAIYIDVEGIPTAADFMVELLAALLRDQHFSRIVRGIWKGTKGFSDFLRDLPSSIDVGGVKIALRERTPVAESWQTYGEQVMSALSQEDPRLLLIIDEFAEMASAIHQEQGRDELARFLRWFRAARTDPKTRTRFLLGSSVNLLDTLDGFGMVETVNDLKVEELRPFTPAIANRFVEEIFAGRGEPLDNRVRDTILDLVGTPIPYLLAVLLTAIFDRRRASHADNVTVEMVHEAFEDDLLGGATAATFQHYRSRLDRYYERDESRAARILLNTLSRADNGITQESAYQLFLQTTTMNAGLDAQEAFLRLMNKLKNDFYIIVRAERYQFYSRVLGAWWKARYGFFGG